MNSPNIKPPALDDPSQFTRIERVPIFATHVRSVWDDKKNESKITEVDEKQLEILCKNTNDRIKMGEYPLITIGHRNLKKPETEQPPLIGFIGYNSIGEYNGKKVILADMFYSNDYKDQIKQFPRRSSEVFRKEGPDGYIDSVAILKRIPELDLGYVTSFEKQDIESFECACEEEDVQMDEDMDETPEKPGENNSDPDNSSDDNVKTPVGEDISDDDNDIDDDGDTASVDNLAKVISNNVAVTLGKDQNFLSAVGQSAAQGIVNNSGFLDKIILRLGELLGKKPAQSSANPGDPKLATENFEKNDDTQNPNVRIGLLEVQNENLRNENKDLKSRIESLELFSKNLEAKNRETSRRSRLSALEKDGVRIDVEKKLEQFKDLNDDTFEMFAKEIEENGARIPLNNAPILTGNRKETPTLPDQNNDAPFDLTEDEMNSGAIEMFARDEGIKIETPADGLKAVRDYMEKSKSNPEFRKKYGWKGK